MELNQTINKTCNVCFSSLDNEYIYCVCCNFVCSKCLETHECNVNKIKKCYNCNENINIISDMFLKHSGCYLCKDCMILLCDKCKRIKHKCSKCHILHCIDCSDGCFYSTSWDDLDIYYCYKCRPITVDEIYNHFKNKYNEQLTIEQIRKLIYWIKIIIFLSIEIL